MPLQDLAERQFEDFTDCVFWIRQVIAVVVGIVWGIIPMVGAVGLIRSVVLCLSRFFLVFDCFVVSTAAAWLP